MLLIRIKQLNLEKVLLFLVITLLPTQLGRHFWPNFAYIYSLKIDYLSPTIYLWDLLVVGLFLIYLLKKPRISLKALLIISIFLITQAVSFLVATNIGAGLVRLEQYFICSLLALYLASQPFSKIIHTIRPALALAIIWTSLLSVMQFMLGRSVGLWILGERNFSLSTPSIANFNWYGQIFLRPYATFPHPNVMGAFITIYLLILIFLRSYTLVIWLGFIAGLLSFSRSVVVVIFLESLYLFKSKLRWFLVLLIIIFPFVFIRFNSAFNFDSLSITRREELAQVSLTQFVSSPFLGIGLNNFIDVSSHSDLVSGPSRFLQPVHNIFLLSLAETGLIGYLGFLVLLAYPLWQLRKSRDQRVIFFILSLFLIIIFLGMFDHYFLTLAQGQRLLFLIWGLSLSLISSTISSPKG